MLTLAHANLHRDRFMILLVLGVGISSSCSNGESSSLDPPPEDTEEQERIGDENQAPVIPYDMCWSSDGMKCMRRGEEPIQVVQSMGFEGLTHDPIEKKLFWTDPLTRSLWKSNLDGSDAGRVTGWPAWVRAIGIAGNKLYWAETDEGSTYRIRRTNLDGNGVDIVINGIWGNTAFAVGPQKLYWIAGSRIGSMNLDGTGIVYLLEGSLPHHLAVTEDKIYWVKYGAYPGGPLAVLRANLDGSQPEQVFEVENGTRRVQIIEGKFYWSLYGDGPIRRSSLDGTGTETLVPSAHDASDFTINDGQLYWSEQNPNSIKRVAIGGDAIEEILSSQPLTGKPVFVGDKLFWSERAGKKIRCANADGTNIKDVIRDKDVISNAIAIADGKLYWQIPGEVRRANLDGTQVETIFVTDDNMYAMAVAGDTMYWTVSNRLKRARLDGTQEETLADFGIKNLSLTIANNKLYFVRVIPYVPHSQILEANLDYTELKEVYKETGDSVGDIEIVDGDLYWSNTATWRLYKRKLAGGDVEELTFDSAISGWLGISH